MLALRCKNILTRARRTLPFATQNVKFVTRCLLFMIVLLTTYYLLLTTSLAAESTQSATPSSNLQAKLKALQAEIASKAAKFKAEVSKRLQNKAYVGFVKSTSDTSLTLATKTGTKIITVDQDTNYVLSEKSAGKKRLGLKNLTLDNFVAALGDIDETDVLKAKKIIKLPSKKEEEKQITYGNIISLGDELVTIQTKQGQNLSLMVTSETIFKSSQNQVISLENLQVNKTIVALGEGSKNRILKARFIYLLPYTTFKIPKTKLSSPSTQIKKKN